MAKLYRIPVEWAVTGVMLVEADSLAQAIEKAENDEPLPQPEDYIDGSFQVNRSFIPYVNKNLSDEDKEQCHE